MISLLAGDVWKVGMLLIYKRIDNEYKTYYQQIVRNLLVEG